MNNVFKAFSRVFLASGSPNPSPRAKTRGKPLKNSVSKVFGRAEALVFGVFGCPLNYTTVTRINSAFPSISSVSNITSGVVAQYAGDVEAEIDAIISTRYTLPLAATCPILVAIATRETIYRIAVQRALIQFPPAQQGKAPLQVQHEDDQKLLQKISDGAINLVTSSGASVAVDLNEIEIYSTTKGYIPTFHEGAWGDMVLDPNKLDDISADRT